MKKYLIIFILFSFLILGLIKYARSQATVAGDVSGPIGATDNAVSRFDGITGHQIQNSTTTISDTGNMAVQGDILATGGDLTLGAGSTGYAGRIILHDADAGDSYSMKLQSNANIPADFSLIFPSDDGTSGQSLQTDGSGNLYWGTGGAVTEEQVEDWVGGMLIGTQTRITVTYDDPSGAINFVVDDMNDDDPESDEVFWSDLTDEGTFTNGLFCTYDAATGYINCNSAGGGGGDEVSVNSSSTTDPDFVSTGNVDFANISNTITANVEADGIDQSHIADNAIQEEHMKSVNSPIDEYCLTYEVTTGDFEWQVCASASAPIDATYLTATANATLTNEITITPTDDYAIIANGATWEIKAIPDCDSSNDALNYDQATNAFSCNSISGTGDNVSVDSSPTTDPDFVSTGDIDFIDTANTITADLNIDVVNASHMANADHGDISWSSGVANIDADVITQAEIADNAIQEEHMKSVNSPIDEYCLTYEVTTGDFEWQVCASGSAPIDATYLTSTANATLTNEITITPTDDYAIIANGTTWQIKQIPDCDTANYALNYDTATNALSCAAMTGTQLTQEQVEDYAGNMVGGGTETRISVTYTDDGANPGYFNFVVDDMNDDDPEPGDVHWSDLTDEGTHTNGQYCTYSSSTGYINCNSSSGGGDNVSVDSSPVVDPDFVSSGDIDFIDTANTITANINADAVNDTHIDWGSGANQVNSDDVPEGTTNYYDADGVDDDDPESDEVFWSDLTDEGTFTDGYHCTYDSGTGYINCNTIVTGDMAKSVYDIDADNMVDTAEDLTCTNCIGETEITDDYLLNDGDVGTGVFDFGGADSFEIPNNATPTVNAAGEIALDTIITDHNGLIRYYDGSTEMIVIAVDASKLTNNDNYIIKYDAASDDFGMESDVEASFPSQVILKVVIDGQGQEIDDTITDPVFCHRIEADATISGWYIYADQNAGPNGVELDVWKDTWANRPPTNTDSIVGTHAPALSSGNDGASDTSLTGGTPFDTDWNQGDMVCIELDTNDTCQRIWVDFVGQLD